MDPRAELYFALSECYKEPVEAFARDVAEGVLYQVVTDSFHALGLSEDTSTLRQPLRQAQGRLFDGAQARTEPSRSDKAQDIAGLSTSLKPLHIAGTPEAVLQTLKRAYYPLFVIPPRFVLPVESVYKDWAGEGGFLAGSRDMIMGPPATDMLRRYQAREILIPQSYKDYPDHLTLLLEYGGLLYEEEGKGKGEKGKGKGEKGKGKREKGKGKREKGIREQENKGIKEQGKGGNVHNSQFTIYNSQLEREQGEFVASHLDTWIEEFAQQVHSLTESPFYRTVVAATVAFVRAERQRLKITVP